MTTTTTTPASQITPGMVVSIYGGSERVAITRMIAKNCTVQIFDDVRWYGLSRDEQVTVLGRFNI